MGGITFSKEIFIKENDGKDGIFLMNTEKVDYYYASDFSRWVELLKVTVGLTIGVIIEEDDTIRVMIRSLSSNRPCRKLNRPRYFTSGYSYGSCHRYAENYKALKASALILKYSDGEWKSVDGYLWEYCRTTDYDDFVSDIWWYLMGFHRELFKQLHEEIEKHPAKEKFSVIPKSFLGFPGIRQAMEKQLNEKIEGEGPNLTVNGSALINYQRLEYTIDEIEEELLREDPRARRHKQVEKSVRKARRNQGQEVQSVSICDGSPIGLTVRDNFGNISDDDSSEEENIKEEDLELEKVYEKRFQDRLKAFNQKNGIKNTCGCPNCHNC